MGSDVDVDLHNCDREQIHLAQAIQPYGIYLRIDSASQCIDAASENCSAIFGRPVTALFGESVQTILGEANARSLELLLQDVEYRAKDAWPIRLVRDGVTSLWEATAHLCGGKVAIELEPGESEKLRPNTLTHFLRHAVAQLRATHDLSSLGTTAAALVREITGFDRVVVYRFDEDNNGIVIAEDRAARVNALLGLHFPASDIPAQARQMYGKNSLRATPDVHYTPSPIHCAPSANMAANEPRIDLTQAILRSVSPIHREYMKNMHLRASMSVSLMHEERLWGLISCSHESGPLSLSFSVRATCDALAEMTALLIDSKERNDDSAYKLRLREQQARLLYRVNQSKNFTEAFTHGSPSLLDVTGATGAAVYYNETLTLTGKTPDQAQVMELLKWLQEQQFGPLFVSQSLPKVYPPAMAYKDSACGLLAAALTRRRSSYVLWFRQEVLQTIHWGGNPERPKEYDPQTMRMHPRKSFAAYKQLIHLTSLPWKEAEKAAAAELIQSISDIVLLKAEELQRLNRDLARSNLELDAFAYAASHDLKEPLRGISNYTELAIEELGETHLVGQSEKRLQTVVKLTRRMEDLIESLLHYSHVGRTQLTMQDVDLNKVVAHVQEMTKQRLEDSRTELRIPQKLPVVRGDPVLLGELFANLITNATKYNDKSSKWVDVGYQIDPAQGHRVLYVRDNGIGIEKRNLTAVFNIFRRLHGRDDFGGGTGTGLTIARQIVQRHGGQMWVESTPKLGSTFLFTLGVEEARA